MGRGAGHAWCGVASPDYCNRQAATLLKFAKAVADPEVAAGLVEKAADLKEQAERPQSYAGDEAPDAAGGLSISGWLSAKEP